MKKQEKKSLASSIKSWRKFRNISQEEAAKRLSIATSTLSNWETGKTKIPGEALPKIAKLYNITVEDVFKT